MTKNKIVIAVTGVPGTGKTTISSLLAKELNAYHLNVNELIKKGIWKDITEGYDEIRQAFIVNEEKLIEKIKEEIEKINSKIIIIDSHLSHLLPKELVDVVVYLRCDPNVLKKRLEERGYPLHKVLENVWAENLDIIGREIEERSHKIVLTYDTTSVNPVNLVKTIVNDLVKFVKINKQ